MKNIIKNLLKWIPIITIVLKAIDEHLDNSAPSVTGLNEN
jgi:hypothetical protein